MTDLKPHIPHVNVGILRMHVELDKPLPASITIAAADEIVYLRAAISAALHTAEQFALQGASAADLQPYLRADLMEGNDDNPNDTPES